MQPLLASFTHDVHTVSDELARIDSPVWGDALVTPPAYGHPMIGHALALTPRPAARVAWDRWIAAGFATGSACFFIGPFPGFVQLVGQGADGIVFFVGSVF